MREEKVLVMSVPIAMETDISSDNRVFLLELLNCVGNRGKQGREQTREFS